jgi:hypothetical protein
MILIAIVGIVGIVVMVCFGMKVIADIVKSNRE